MWRDQAEHVAESLPKGSRVVVGRLRQQTCMAGDGSTRSVVEVVAEELGPEPSLETATPTPGDQIELSRAACWPATPSSLCQEAVIDVTSRMCRGSPTERWRSCDDRALSHP